jgi:uncharacterized membrane protein YczE
MAFGTSICNNTGLGIDPFNAFCMALSRIININLGTMVMLIQIILGILVFVLNKRFLGFGSLVPMISFGYFLQFFNWFISQIISFDFNILSKLILLLMGMVAIAIGMSMYMECNLGMVPYDCLAFIISDYLGKKMFIFRVILDSTIAITAFLLGGPINVGTILLAVSIGPLIDIFRRNLVSKLFDS